jgi:hypothetical protein
VACAGLAFGAARAALGQDETGGEPAAGRIMVDDPGAAPFSSAELTQALLARLLPAEKGAPAVRVSGAGAGAVAVQVGDRSRVVTLGERTGPEAARVVALVIADLASASPGPSLPADDAVAKPSVGVAAAAQHPSSQVSGVVPRHGPATRLSVVAGALLGTRSEESSAVSVDADLSLPLDWHALRLVPSAGILYGPTRNPGSFDAASFSAAVARLLGGWSYQEAFDFLGGSFVEPYSIAGANPHTGVLFGAEALVRLNMPIGSRARMVFGARADVYANRVRVLFVDGGAYATPRLALGLALGLAWEWWGS